MKLKSKLVIYLFVALLVSAVLILSIDHSGLIYDICLSIFSGALLSLLIAIIEYLNEKERVISKYTEIVMKNIMLIKNVKYFEDNKYKCPVDLIIYCLEEKRVNDFLAKYNQSPKYEAKKKLIEYFEANKSKLKFTPDNDGSTPEKFYEYILGLFLSDIETCIEKYKLVNEINEVELLACFEDIHFVFLNKKIKSHINKKINERIVELIRSVKENYMCIEAYNNMKDDYYHDVIYCIHKINYDLFFEETANRKDDEHVSVYCKTNCILNEMKNIRSLHYGDICDSLLYGVEHYFRNK